MVKSSSQLEWCIIRLGDDMNWWVEKISNAIHWDMDGLSVIDPNQINHIIDLCESLKDYGFDPEIINEAFFKFRIEKEQKNSLIRLVRVRDSLLETEEQLFALPEIMDEEKGPYADFLDQITKSRVKLLNDLIEFDENLTIDELEEEINARQNNDYFEGRAVHFFNEITAILEYVPDGFELDVGDDSETTQKKELEEFPDIDVLEEKIEEDETMKWDDDTNENEDVIVGEEPIIEKPRRGRPRKK